MDYSDWFRTLPCLIRSSGRRDAQALGLAWPLMQYFVFSFLYDRYNFIELSGKSNFFTLVGLSYADLCPESCPSTTVTFVACTESA
jgi:hypothetical protein